MNHGTTRPGRVRRGFTLIELLVVIGIIGVLLAIVLPAIFSTSRQAERSRSRADLAAVEMGLEEYRKDFKDYPRQIVTSAERKKSILGYALVGTTGTGFRTAGGGRTWGPYVPLDKFQFDNVNKVAIGGLLDRYGSPIFYYPRWQNYKPKVGSTPATPLFGSPNNPLTPDSANRINSVYDWGAMYPLDPGFTSSDQDGYSCMYLRKAMGDDDLDDQIGSGETLKETPPFLLLSKGPKKKFTVESDPVNGKNKLKTQFEKCDEVANIPNSK